jgi:hypothetical protein
VKCLKNYKELNVWQKTYNLVTWVMREKERFQEIREEIEDVERMLKTMIRSLENKHLNP